MDADKILKGFLDCSFEGLYPDKAIFKLVSDYKSDDYSIAVYEYMHDGDTFAAELYYPLSTDTDTFLEAGTIEKVLAGIGLIKANLYVTDHCDKCFYLGKFKIPTALKA